MSLLMLKKTWLTRDNDFNNRGLRMRCMLELRRKDKYTEETEVCCRDESKSKKVIIGMKLTNRIKTTYRDADEWTKKNAQEKD